MAERISAELLATCGALGFYDGITYRLDTHCIDVIKDLIKYLKRDDDSHTVRQYLGQAKLLETDLKKIFIIHYDKTELWDVLLRLLINLTSPALMIYNEELPTERNCRNVYEQLIVHLQRYKVALADEHVWSTVGKKLKEIFNMETMERGEENELIIERIFTLLKNVLQIPANDNEIRSDSDTTLHDEVLFAFHTSGLVDLLLFVASNDSEEQYHMQVLEIIALMLQEQCPRSLASAGLQRNALEKEKDSAKLMAIREKESREKMDKIKKYAGSRHSRFGGVFVVENMKAIGDNQMICHKPLKKIEALDFGREKAKIKKAKKKAPINDSEKERTSALSVRLFLKEFCVEFLNAAYNPVMRFVRACINGRNHGVAVDVSYYLWTLRFFMEFNRHYKFEVKFVSETISTEIFHLVQRQLEQFYELMITDKKKIPVWAKRLHLAVKAYQELLHTLCAMDISSDKGVRESSKIIKSNIFYVPEYRETILSQLVYFDAVKMSQTYLIDLVTTAHIFLKMLEQFCKNRTIVVGKKAKKASRAKKKKKSGAQKSASSAPTPSLSDLWDDAAPEVSAVMREGTIPEVVPFDATLETPIDEQKADAMKKIQKLLRKRNFEEAVGLLRAARQVWPENDHFGRPDIPVEEEFLSLRDIYFAELGVDYDDGVGQGNAEAEADQTEEMMDDEEDDEEDEEGGREMAIEETNFNFEEFLRRFANVKIVKTLSILLARFEHNSEQVNHYAVKMLHRIAWDCKMPGMLFQASIFRIFQRILDSKSPAHREIQKFAVFVIRRFAKVAATNRKAFMELLFWKATREATEMVDGYDAAPTNEKVSRAMWNETEEDELRTLFMEHQTKKHSQDLVDWILENIISDNRTRRGVIKKLKEMCLVVNSKTVRSEVQKRLPKEWSEEEMAELTEVWDRVREDRDPVELIHESLTIKRPKNKIKEKLLEMGLAKDRKELRKKRGRQLGEPVKSSWEKQSDSEGSENTSDSDADDVPSKKRGKTVSKTTKRAKKSKKQPVVIYSNSQLLGLLKDVIDKDMTRALEWLKESFEEEIEDRDEESDEGVPLVPLSEESSAAMDSPNFQRLLRAIGIEPPADEQETYWRIPASMLVATIRKRCLLIQNALAGKFLADDNEPTLAKHADSDSSEVNDEDSTDAEDNNDIGNVIKLFNTNSRDSTDAVSKSGVEKVFELNSNGENGSSQGNVEDDSLDEPKRGRSQDSDSELPTVKKRRVIISDDDDDDDDNESPAGNESLEMVVKKPSRRLMSDDEDDDI